MSSTKDRMQKKLPAWGLEEHNILVEVTNHQLDVEAKDHSKIIPWTQHWRNVSSRLRERGYNRTHNDCKIYKRSIELEVGDTQFAASDGNLAGESTAIPESIEDSNSNKRPLPQETDIPSEEGPSPSSKKHRWGDIICHEAVENIQAPPRVSSEPPSDDQPQIILGEEEAPEVNASGDIAVTNMHIESRGTSPKTADGVINLEPSSSGTIEREGNSQDSNKIEGQPGECSSADSQRPITPPAIPSTSIPSQKEWAARQIRKFKTEIQVMDADIAERTGRVALIEQSLGNLKAEQDKNNQDKDQEIARIEEEFKRKFDALKSRFMMLKKSKQSELDRLKINGDQVSRKKIGLMRYEELVAYLDTEHESSQHGHLC